MSVPGGEAVMPTSRSKWREWPIPAIQRSILLWCTTQFCRWGTAQPW